MRVTDVTLHGICSKRCWGWMWLEPQNKDVPAPNGSLQRTRGEGLGVTAGL